jgi:hypothetical protein
LHRKNLSRSIRQGAISGEQDRGHRQHHTKCGAPSSTFCHRLLLLQRLRRHEHPEKGTGWTARVLQHANFISYKGKITKVNKFERTPAKGVAQDD